MNTPVYASKTSPVIIEPHYYRHGLTGWMEIPNGSREERVYCLVPSNRERLASWQDGWITLDTYRNQLAQLKICKIRYYAAHPELLREKIEKKSGRRRKFPDSFSSPRRRGLVRKG